MGNFLKRSPGNGDGGGYGSLPSSNTQEGITYCVHGKPSGCCATVVCGGPQPPPPPITIPTEHCHRERVKGINKKARNKLIIASSLCLVFMIAEIVGGVLSGSLAIATDAAHLLTDLAGFLISLFAIWVAGREPTRYFPFGWYRAEVIGALASVLTIWVVTGVLVYMAVDRIINMNFTIDAVVMLISSSLGVVINIVMGASLHQHGHSHAKSSGEGNGHGHAHDSQNINVRAAFIHVIGDFIQSIGVFIAALIIYFKPTWIIVDPICTFLFSVLVLFTTCSILKDALLVLMEGIPANVDYNDVMNTLMGIEGVVKVHNLRIWALSLDKPALAAHLAISNIATPQEVLRIASQKIHAKYNFFEMTLQIERYKMGMDSCSQCQLPA